MSKILLPALERMGDVRSMYSDSMDSLRVERKQLGQVRRAIGRQVHPLLSFVKYLKRDWTPLSNLMETQITVVSGIGATLYDMATTCQDDREILFAYVGTLEERTSSCQAAVSELETTLAETTTQEGTGLLQRLRQALEVTDLQGHKQRTERRLEHTEKYAQEVTRLLPMTTHVHQVFLGAAETVQDWAVHLEATSQTYAKLIAFGKTSAAMQGVLQVIEQNSKAVYGAVDRSVADIALLFRRLQTGAYRPTARLLERST